jgi:dihydropyrimidine dehydrogenase (NAD+) subunit PreA
MTPNLSIQFAGLTAPNPFWLASGPPTNTAAQVLRAFEAGWGAAVWKTVTDQPTRNVTSRYAALDFGRKRVMGLSNIELISDRPLEDNLREIRLVKNQFPDRPLIVSVMVENRRETWHEVIKKIEDTAADAIELNFGCPHGLPERGQGSAVGQVPQYTQMVTAWAREATTLPIIVKLTPNVTDIKPIARAAFEGGASAISLINTVNSIIGVNLNTFTPHPDVAGQGTHGGYCGSAVKPIALHLVSQITTNPAVNLPVCGIGGISTWRDAAEFMLLGAGSVQLCSAVMHHGFGIIEPLTAGLKNWMTENNFESCYDFIGRTTPAITTWSALDINHKTVARIDQETCINCGLCYVSCEDGCYQSINWAKVKIENGKTSHARRTESQRTRHAAVPPAPPGRLNIFTVNEQTCTGCNMCALVCPIENCITMQPVDEGTKSGRVDHRFSSGEVDSKIE